MFNLFFSSVRRLALPALCGAAVFIGTSAQAGFIPSTWEMGATATSAGGRPIAAKAEFQVVGGNLQITLSNLTANANTKAASELLGGLTFTLNGASGGSRATNVNIGTSVSVDGSGTTTVNGTVGGTNTAWGLSSTGANYTLATVGSGSADLMIIGPGDGSGNYPNANNSLNTHSPLLSNTGTFVITGITGLENATVGNVYFWFNSTKPTESGFSPIPGVNTVPEPSSLALAGLASLAGVVGAARARRRQSV